MEGIKQASVSDAFTSYSRQKTMMNSKHVVPSYVTMTYYTPTTIYAPYGGLFYTGYLTFPYYPTSVVSVAP